MTTKSVMPSHDPRPDSDIPGPEALAGAVVRLNGNILGLVLGILGAAALFLVTNWLVIKGGDPVGPHLALLGQYLIGYRVTFAGSLIGAGYAFVVGYVAGRIIGTVYNRVADIRQG